MNTVKVAVRDLLAHLKANREAHIAEFNESMVGYREAMIKAFAQALKKAKANEDVDHMVDIVRPFSYLESYDEAIAMLEWTIDQEVELDRQQFKQYVQDEWVWKQAFVRTAGMYKAS